MSILHSPADVAAVVRAAGGDSERRILVGIVGAPGSGKSTLAADLVAALGPAAIVLPMDGFHLPQTRLRELGRRDRMGAPDTFDVHALRALLARLVESSGDLVFAPGFDRRIEEPVADAIAISPDFSTVVVEGNYLLLDDDGWRDVAGFLAVTFFLELDHEERVARLIARHERFGKSPDAARAWVLGSDETNAGLIETTAIRADYRVRLESG